MQRKFRIAAFAVVALVPLLIAATGGFPSRPTFQQVTVVGAITAGGNPVTTETSGSESLTVTAGCTTNPAVNATWRKVGTHVVMRLPTVSCTSSGGLFQIGTVSAPQRSASNVLVASVSGTCAGANEQFFVSYSGGQFNFAAADNSNCPAASNVGTNGNLVFTFSTAL